MIVFVVSCPSKRSPKDQSYRGGGSCGTDSDAIRSGEITITIFSHISFSAPSQGQFLYFLGAPAGNFVQKIYIFMSISGRIRKWSPQFQKGQNIVVSVKKVTTIS